MRASHMSSVIKLQMPVCELTLVACAYVLPRPAGRGLLAGPSGAAPSHHNHRGPPIELYVVPSKGL